MRVWLDDIRPAPPGWRRTTTVAQTLRLLAEGHVAEVSLDYDLDETDPEHDGLEVLEWIARAAELGIEPPAIHFHTANPWGAARMSWTWRRLEKRLSPDVRRLKRDLTAI